ncbi:MAG: RsmF rRNA methyltransferase first C-terminal domain-containing protein [Clostridia bacterium]|nr:RsmF rRNA methyltransferase first C-terminal domain-containing protein [Clostridia bacterium]
MFDLPQEFSDRMKDELGTEYDAFIQSYTRPAEKAVRANTLKITPEEFEKLAPVPLDGKVPWEESGFYAQGEGLGKTVLHAAGLYYVQEPSAMCAVPELEIKSGERVLDLCAAPGGKSTQIAQYMQGEGILVANEMDFKRHGILKSNIERCGVKNAAVTCQSPENLAGYYQSYFDKILVDAPCSGEGMFKKEEAAVREWSLKNVQACAARQAKILESAHKMLAGGGRLVYSTCTFAPDEDERQIQNFLNLHPEYSLVKIKKLLPHKVRGEGHFCAVLEKPSGEHAEDFRLKSIKPSDKKEFEEFKKGVISADFKNIVKLGDSVYSLVDNFPAELKAGVKLGEVKGGRFEPAHALAMCLKPKEFSGLEVDEATAIKYLRGLTFDCTVENGWRVVTYKGYPLGWCKVVNGVAKNHLPKGIRI